VVDFLRDTLFEQDPKKPGAEGVERTDSYLAFVVTKDKVPWVDLGPAQLIEDAVAAWREAITGGKDIPSERPAKVRELVWAKVRTEFPDNVKVVYVSPDLALCRVPSAALPGDKPRTILPEDCTVAVIPHAVFLLDKLWPRFPFRTAPPGSFKPDQTEALGQAQLEIYRHSDKIPELAAGFRGKVEEVPGTGEEVLKAGPDGKAHPPAVGCLHALRARTLTAEVNVDGRREVFGPLRRKRQNPGR
jgi:hypothetical protein